MRDNHRRTILTWGLAGTIALIGAAYAANTTLGVAMSPHDSQPAAETASKIDIQSGSYGVLSLVSADDPYYAAVEELIGVHPGAEVFLTDVEHLESVLPDLQAGSLAQVAIVMRPSQLDINLARRLLALMTKLDGDPLVDVGYGVITGATPHDAVALVQAGQVAARKKPETVMMGVGDRKWVQKSRTSKQPWPIRGGSLPHTQFTISSDESTSVDPEAAELAPRDQAFIQSCMPKLDGVPLIVLAGHGYPREVVGGPTYQDLQGRDFSGAVVFNVACYTGVTDKWFDIDWQSRKRQMHQVAPEQSFCLNLLKTGVAGYFAYVCPRPSGPTMFADMVSTATQGISLGELQRAQTNRVILAHLQQGFDEVNVPSEIDGASLDAERDVQAILIEMSTGGILFGDPACVPFEAMSGQHPVKIDVQTAGDHRMVDIHVDGVWHNFVGEQINMWDGKPTYRLEARIPLGDRHVENIELVELNVSNKKHRIVGVVEEHGGERVLYMKMNFPMQQPSTWSQLFKRGISAKFDVKLTDAPQPSIIRRESP